MDMTGPTRIAFALGLVFSVAAYNEMNNYGTGQGPTNIETVSGKLQSCQNRGVDTVIGRLGCGDAAPANRRTMNGGASFVRVGE